MKLWTRTGLVAGAVGIILGTPFIEAAWQNSASAANRVTSAKPAVPAPVSTATVSPVTVELAENMMANIHVELVRAQTAGAWLSATGKVQFNEERTTRILAPMPGQVLGLKLRVGDSVEQDQLVFSIKSREVASLVTDLIESQREQDLAEKTHAMTKDLFDHQAASRIALQQAENDLEKSHAHVARGEEALRVLGLDPERAVKSGGLQALIPVRAASSGVVIERNVASGQFVPADSTALLTIADLSAVWVLADVFERDIHLIRPGEKVSIIAAAYPDRHFEATVERINDKVDPDSRTLKVRMLVSNPQLLLKPEMFVTAALEFNQSQSGLTVPAKAIFAESGKSYVFASAGERRFEKRAVTAAPDGPGRIRVTRGLTARDSVVTDGVLLLNLRAKQAQE